MGLFTWLKLHTFECFADLDVGEIQSMVKKVKKYSFVQTLSIILKQSADCNPISSYLPTFSFFAFRITVPIGEVLFDEMLKIFLR